MSFEYNEEIADYICECVAGGATMEGISYHKGMPSPGQVRLWIKENVGFKVKYEDAILDRIAYDYDLLQRWFVILLDEKIKVTEFMTRRIKLACGILKDTMPVAVNVVTGRSALNSESVKRVTVEYVEAVKQIADPDS